ncbi:hypothetical protein ACFXTI_012643 [Malus domestica]
MSKYHRPKHDKTIRFEDEPNVSHQTLGPLFKDNVPEAIIEMLKEHCLNPLFQRYDWSKWESARPKAFEPRSPRLRSPGLPKWNHTSVTSGRLSVSLMPSNSQPL